MARNIKRNILKENDSDIAGIDTSSSGQYWREPLEDGDEWLEQGERWGRKKTDGTTAATWAQSVKQTFGAGDEGRSTPKAEYEDRGSFQHDSAEDRSRDFRADQPDHGGSNGWLSVLIGLGGGLAATYVMTQAQSAWSNAQGQGTKPNQGNSAEVDQQSTVKVANRLADAANTSIPQEQRQTAGNAVHYGFGTLMGGMYGAIAGALDDAPFGTGVLFGVGLWLAVDEFVLPYLGLSKPPQQRDLKEHAYEASMHAVYGLCLDAVNLLRKRVA